MTILFVNSNLEDRLFDALNDLLDESSTQPSDVPPCLLRRLRYRLMDA